MVIPVAESHFNRAAFAEQYEAVRPRLPEAFLDVVCQYARMDRPRLVVDLGCGTGLSAFAWAKRAERVVGIEPAEAMLETARRRTPGPHVELRQGFGDAIGVGTGAADIVTAVQSFHWMEPRATLEEVARVLRPGGVFAAADCDGPPSMDWEVEEAGRRFIETAARLRRELGLAYAWPEKWPKGQHLERLRESGHFTFTKEVLLHNSEVGDAERCVQQAISWMVEDVDEFYARGVTDEQLGLTAFRAVAERIIGAGSRWFTSWRVRLGVKA
jgi:ubiquinone/menaquinone biosynthesis C-methylase UbiE